MDVHRQVSIAPTPSPGRSTGREDESSLGEGASGPPAAIVPDVQGLVFSAAVRHLWRSGINVDLVLARESARPLWSVVEQDPAPGSDTPASGSVNLVLSLHRLGGAGVIGTVICRPEMDELRDPYCVGKLVKY
jgi:beta-lactam-binding protein with PASTA domain